MYLRHRNALEVQESVTRQLMRWCRASDHFRGCCIRPVTDGVLRHRRGCHAAWISREVCGDPGAVSVSRALDRPVDHAPLGTAKDALHFGSPEHAADTSSDSWISSHTRPTVSMIKSCLEGIRASAFLPLHNALYASSAACARPTGHGATQNRRRKGRERSWSEH
jgi:hypothetical protein